MELPKETNKQKIHNNKTHVSSRPKKLFQGTRNLLNAGFLNNSMSANALLAAEYDMAVKLKDLI